MITYYNVSPNLKAFIDGVQSTIPVDVKFIANYLNIKVYYRDLNIDGYLIYEPITNVFEIHINKRKHRNRQRFTLAHEIAHFILHKDYVMEYKVIDMNPEYRDFKENEADELAVEILMPFNHIHRLIEKGVNTVSLLAKEFEVSEESMRRRLGI